jgi:hypothetical protein
MLLRLCKQHFGPIAVASTGREEAGGCDGHASPSLAGGASKSIANFIWMPKKDCKPKARSSGEGWIVCLSRCAEGSLLSHQGREARCERACCNRIPIHS